MPYIKEEDRKQLDSFKKRPNNAGELNYHLHTFIAQYVEDNGESYQTYNDILGALEGIKLELYRRRVAGYEDQKKDQNGDIEFYKTFDPKVETKKKITMNGALHINHFKSDMGEIKFFSPLKINWWEMERDENSITVEIFLDDGINWAEKFSLDARIPYSKIESFRAEDISKTVEKSVHFDFNHAFFHYQGDPNYCLTHWAIYGNFKDKVELIEAKYENNSDTNFNH